MKDYEEQRVIIYFRKLGDELVAFKISQHICIQKVLIFSKPSSILLQ